MSAAGRVPVARGFWDYDETVEPIKCCCWLRMVRLIYSRGASQDCLQALGCFSYFESLLEAIAGAPPHD